VNDVVDEDEERSSGKSTRRREGFVDCFVRGILVGVVVVT